MNIKAIVLNVNTKKKKIKKPTKRFDSEKKKKKKLVLPAWPTSFSEL